MRGACRARSCIETKTWFKANIPRGCSRNAAALFIKGFSVSVFCGICRRTESFFAVRAACRRTGDCFDKTKELLDIRKGPG